jgi:hypothetical protein
VPLATALVSALRSRAPAAGPNGGVADSARYEAKAAFRAAGQASAFVRKSGR